MPIDAYAEGNPIKNSQLSWNKWCSGFSLQTWNWVTGSQNMTEVLCLIAIT